VKVDKDKLSELALAATFFGNAEDGFAPTNLEYLSTPNQAFVRAANPQAVLELLKENAELDRIADELMEERDARTDQIDAIADALGDDGEWSNLHDRGNAALELAHGALAEVESLRAENRQFLDDLRRSGRLGGFLVEELDAAKQRELELAAQLLDPNATCCADATRKTKQLREQHACEVAALVHERDAVRAKLANLLAALRQIVPVVRVDDALGYRCPGCGAKTGIDEDGADVNEPCTDDCWQPKYQAAVEEAST
jgi:hypothetical protein